MRERERKYPKMWKYRRKEGKLKVIFSPLKGFEMLFVVRIGKMNMNKTAYSRFIVELRLNFQWLFLC